MIIVISGPSGVGKGAVSKELVKLDPRFEIAITCTTRHPRENEIDGIDYFFVSEESFRKMIEEGELAEYSIVHGNLYGIPQRFVDLGLNNEKDVIFQIDVQGAKKIKNKYDEALLIFLMPPSIEALIERLNKRGTENLSEIEKRTKRAKEEIEERYLYDYVVVNDILENTVKEIYEIILKERKLRIGL
ncbi:guanylate kinase [Caldisericum exile]|uniref:Guanylate kinase n=1 Tax=Caldisericum exile (strain DSM 21853 / NBRC 104410 / AZM16c01) TaxID=511051 RepID=A0A7U6GER1_CALEA|nr:guanylate kinase [Caldisericum exile]BAL81039.1 guanylate kinase [Caldisericum exile AZM16c01]